MISSAGSDSIWFAAAAESGQEREVNKMSKWKEMKEFSRYAVDPRKAKAAVLATELVIKTHAVKTAKAQQH